MKSIKDCIKIPLTHISNFSFVNGIFPSELKRANVVPLFKSGEDFVFTNYRPVSIHPVFSKLIERLMHNRVFDFINTNRLLYKYQFGFQDGKSTCMALITLIDKISAALDNGEIVVGLFLDFSKAFDTVNHTILLNKLFHYGIQDIPLKWFKSYLSQRYQYVTYNNHKPTNKLIQCGVPQGSILGPLLLLLYINDLSAVSKSCLNIMFADDTNMFIAGNNINAVCTQLNDDLGLVQEWLACNKLSFNVKKTHYMVFTPWNKDIKDMDIKINNECIERVYHTKFLDVQLNAKLS